jgi:hypothetical protein
VIITGTVLKRTSGSGTKLDNELYIIVIIIVGIILVVICIILVVKFAARPAGVSGIVLGARTGAGNPPFTNVLFNPALRDISFDNPHYRGLTHVSSV